MGWNRFLFGCFFGVFLMIQGCQMDPCGSAPADLIENMEDLVREADGADYEPDSDQWKKYDDRFRVYYEDCFEVWRPDMTFQQKGEFAGLVTRYVTTRFGRSFFRSLFGKDKKNQENMQEFFDNLGKDLEKFLEENQDWGQDFLDDLMKNGPDGNK